MLNSIEGIVNRIMSIWNSTGDWPVWYPICMRAVVHWLLFVTVWVCHTWPMFRCMEQGNKNILTIRKHMYGHFRNKWLHLWHRRAWWGLWRYNTVLFVDWKICKIKVCSSPVYILLMCFITYIYVCSRYNKIQGINKK